jgi:hypothetical protein
MGSALGVAEQANQLNQVLVAGALNPGYDLSPWTIQHLIKLAEPSAPLMRPREQQ